MVSCFYFNCDLEKTSTLVCKCAVLHRGVVHLFLQDVVTECVLHHEKYHVDFC